MNFGSQCTENEKIVVIVGGKNGFGTILSNHFHSCGWHVVCTSRTPEYEEQDHKTFYQVDVNDRAQIDSCVASVMQRWGRIDAVVVNAGIAIDNVLARLDSDDFDKIIHTNTKGFFSMAQAVIPSMMQHRDGHIIAISSFTSTVGRAGQSLYSASKAALGGLIKSLAREAGEYNIKVNAVMPGFMPVGMGERTTDHARCVAMDESVLHSLASAQESAAFIEFLSRMKYTSGQIFNIDSRITGWI